VTKGRLVSPESGCSKYLFGRPFRAWTNLVQSSSENAKQNLIFRVA